MEELKEVFGRIIEVEARIKEFQEEHRKKTDPNNNATYKYHTTELDLITKKYLEAREQYLKRRQYLERHINRITKECKDKEPEPLYNWWILQRDDLLQERERLLKSLVSGSKS